MQFIRRLIVLPLLLVVLAGPLAGCAGMPIQEMSDARQAIRSAERAGAAQYAPELLQEARTLVERARQDLHEGEYREARDRAESARAKAMEARRIAEEAAGGAGA